MLVRTSSADDFSAHLELLAEIGQDFAASLDIGSTLDKALARIAEYLEAEAASLFLLERDDRELVCRACYGPTDIAGLRIGAGQGIVGRSVQENDCQIVRDVRQDPDFAKRVDEESGFHTRSILCAPMSVKNRRVGAIELLNKSSGDGLFSEQDRRVLQVLASSAALAIINARLTATVIEQERDKRERDLAAEIQRNLLPQRRGAHFPVSGINVPARGVSGDFFDFFELDDGRIGFSLGDVSGKGMNAALLMAKTISLYRCLGKSKMAPGELLSRVNEELCETGTRGMFVTMVGGIYDPEADTVHFANAGHEPPILLAEDGSFTSFPADAPPVGIAADLFPPEGVMLEEASLDGGTFYVFTDGVTESPLEGGEMFGVQGLCAALVGLGAQGATATERLGEIASRLARPGVALHDDLTLLAIQKPQGAATGG